jgi:hypothetical protein
VSSKKTLHIARIIETPSVNRKRGRRANGNNKKVGWNSPFKKRIRSNKGIIDITRLNVFEHAIETMKMYLGIGTCPKSLALLRIECSDIMVVLAKKFQGSNPQKRNPA